VLYTLPEGACIQRDAIRDMMIAGGVRRWTTKFTGRSFSKLDACEAVRGKPSRMKDADGDIDGFPAGDAETAA